MLLVRRLAIMNATNAMRCVSTCRRGVGQFWGLGGVGGRRALHVHARVDDQCDKLAVDRHVHARAARQRHLRVPVAASIHRAQRSRDVQRTQHALPRSTSSSASCVTTDVTWLTCCRNMAPVNSHIQRISLTAFYDTSAKNHSANVSKLCLLFIMQRL